jgi:uncharacterized protein YjbJ (UPF0337 family)
MTNETLDDIKAKADHSGATDKAKGHANETIGTVKSKIGGLIGDHELEAKGDAQNAEGKAQRVKGEVKEAIDETVEKVKAGAEVVSDKIKEVLHKK